MKKTPAYEKDPYLCELDTKILGVGTENAMPFADLEDSILYPEGGGQPGDRGWVASVRVVDVRRRDGVIRHYLEAPVEPGACKVVLDWGRRFDHMQQHTAQHLLTAIAEDRFGWPTTAFHLGESASDVELDVPTLESPELAELEEAVAAEIRSARRVTARRVSMQALEKLNVRSRGLPAGHTGTIRLVEIEEVDLNTCGGTHVRSTAELEALKIVSTEPMRGGIRVYFLAGTRVRKRLGEEIGRSTELRSLLGVPDSELPSAVRSRFDQIQELIHREKTLREELIEMSAEALSHRPGDLVHLHLKTADPGFLQQLARQFAHRAPGKAALLSGGTDSDGFFVVVAGDQVNCDVQSLGRQVAMLLHGRGGGSGRVFQGRATRLFKRKEALALFQLELDRD